MNIFDIIGPVMIGPSSSHTAGAARIGRITRKLLGENPKHALIKLHGSFAKTYKGHGTDKAIIGGLLGFEVDDSRIRYSPDFAKENGLEFSIVPVDLGLVHPNTVMIELVGETGKKVKVLGASIGGGNILIKQVNGFDLEFTGQYNTLVVAHNDAPGAVATVSTTLAVNQINIASMKLYRAHKGGKAIMIIETDQNIDDKIVNSIKNMSMVIEVTAIEAM